MIELAMLLVMTLMAWILGSSVVSFDPGGRDAPTSDQQPDTLVNHLLAILVGLYLQTLLTFCLSLCGLSLSQILAVISVLTIPLAWHAFVLHRHAFGFGLLLSYPMKWRWKISDVIVALFFIETVCFCAWQFSSMPLYFEDPLFHWGTRARELYSDVNWSWEAQSPHFLGNTSWNRHYPLFLPLLRAQLATMVGSWNDLIPRIDGLLFFVINVLLIGQTARSFSSLTNRGLPSAANISLMAYFSCLILPWHIAGGNADLAYSSFLLASVIAALNSQLFLAGLLLAGCAWTKNDGLVLATLSMSIAMIAIMISTGSSFAWPLIQKTKTTPNSRTCIRCSKLASVLLGGLTLLPWLIFRQRHQLALAPDREGLHWHFDSLPQVISELLWNPTHGFFWVTLV